MRPQLSSPAPSLQQASGIMLVLSCLLLVEGITRVNLSAGSKEWKGNSHTYPPILLLVGGVGEVLFSFLGICTAWMQLVHNVGSPLLTKATLACEAVFGWFVFIVYVLAQPSFQVARLTPAAFIPGLSESETKGVIMMGLVGSIGVCAALQGGQFFFTFQLLNLQEGKEGKYEPAHYRTRLVYYSFLVCLKGVSELALGSILHHSALGGAKYAAPIVSPPFVVTHSQLSIADGLFVLATGLIGITIGLLTLRPLASKFSILALFCLLIQFGLYDMGSIGPATPAAVVGALQVGLTLALMLMPAYCAASMAQPHKQHMMDESTKVDDAVHSMT